MCRKNKEQVQEHILSVHRLHRDKAYIVAPYFVGDHWSLHIISSKYKRGYILDSIMTMKSKDCYKLTSVIEEAFRTPLKWEMVKCKQQLDIWECGYITIQHMFEFFHRYQHDLPDDIWNDDSYVDHAVIDEWTESFVSLYAPEIREML